MSEQLAPPSRIPHDRIFKEFLHRFLPQFLHLFFPEKAARLNFETLTFPNQELIVNLPNEKALRITDVVAEVETYDGENEVIIVHIEVEASEKASLPRRMFEYYSLLRDKPVLPIALVLLPHGGGLGWQQYREHLFAQELVRFTYGNVGLRDLPSHDYLAQGEPVAAALAALMQPGAETPGLIKLQALRNVLGSGLTEGEKRFLMGVIETYLPRAILPPDTGEEIMEALDEMELMWHEKIQREALEKGRAEGRAKGREEEELIGKRKVLLRLLAAKFGPLPAAFVARIQAGEDDEVLDTLSEEGLTADSLDDLSLPA